MGYQIISLPELLLLGQAGVALFAIVDPLGNVPLMLAFTSNQTSQQRRHTATIAALVTAIILITMTLLGPMILQLFSIRLESLRVGGGLLLLLMGLAMLHSRVSSAKQTADEEREAIEAEDVGVVPMAMPLMAGPGAITLVISEAGHMPGMANRVGLVIVILLVSLISWVILRMADRVSNHIKRTGINVLTRLMGLLVVAISVEMIASGLIVLFPILASSSPAVGQ
ncbi:MAG: NAAT family transporter [Phycisphaeraceae bacterium]|nr:NAAT family transporter [Phycisphaeraceae bacterium]